MILSHLFLITFTISIHFIQLKYACKLDDMKLLASEACESLFRETITKRHSPIKKNYNYYYYNKHKNFKHFTTKCHMKAYRKIYEKHSIQLCKENYPKYGYLLLDKKYSKIKLQNYNQYYDDYRYENEVLDPTSELYFNYTSLVPSSSSSSSSGSQMPLPIPLQKKNYRYKRDYNDEKITYCCQNSCRSDVFCK